MTVAELAQKRKTLRVTQRDVTARLGWNQETLTDIELGRIAITDETRGQIEEAIDRICQEKTSREEVSAVG